MNRELISEALSQIDDVFVAEAMLPPELRAGHAPERTMKMRKSEKSRHSISARGLISLILAACLTFTLAAAAYALNLFGIREMFRNDNRELPGSSDPYIRQHSETASADDWSARITESLCDSSKVMVTVTVSGGDKYIVAPTDARLGETVSAIGLEGEQTLEEYAGEKGKELLYVGASLLQNDHLGIFTQAQTFVNASDGEMNILINADRNGGEVAGEAVCHVHAKDEAGNVLRLELPFTLEEAPVSDSTAFTPVDPDAVPGITAGDAVIAKTPLGWTVRFMCTVTDQKAFDSILKMESDEITQFEGGGFVLEDDGNWYSVWSMGEGNLDDTLTVHFYDWNKQPIGDLVFKRE